MLDALLGSCMVVSAANIVQPVIPERVAGQDYNPDVDMDVDGAILLAFAALSIFCDLYTILEMTNTYSTVKVIPADQTVLIGHRPGKISWTKPKTTGTPAS